MPTLRGAPRRVAQNARSSAHSNATSPASSIAGSLVHGLFDIDRSIAAPVRVPGGRTCWQGDPQRRHAVAEQRKRGTPDRADVRARRLASGSTGARLVPCCNPHYAGRQRPEDDGSGESAFGLERDLQKALRANIGQLETGLKIVDGGTEKNAPAGRIDITAEDPGGTTWSSRCEPSRRDRRVVVARPARTTTVTKPEGPSGRCSRGQRL